MEQVIVWEKVTVWKRYTVGVKSVDSNQEAINKVIDCYKRGDDIWCDDDIFPLDSEFESETEELMSVKENGKFPTIEIEKCDGQVVWDNGEVR